ncbi:MAG: hypothetical protein IJG50_07575 [Clostridia bacterium]|nr:hypothetical protein [Clostridia bacterium]
MNMDISKAIDDIEAVYSTLEICEGLQKVSLFVLESRFNISSNKVDDGGALSCMYALSELLASSKKILDRHAEDLFDARGGENDV